MKNNFDRIAPFYDLLSKLVFGDKLEKIQKQFLDHLPLNSRVLIVGGGTGKILEWLPQEKRLAVTFVELSEQMIKKARTRNSKAMTTDFHQTDIMKFEGKFDYIIANFFLDCFEEETLQEVLRKLAELMNLEGKLVVGDFCANDIKRDRLINWSMHRFFKIASNLESKELKDIRGIMLASDFVETHFESFDRGQLFSGVYGKRLTQ